MSLDKVRLCSACYPLGGALREGVPLSWGFGGSQDFLGSDGVGLLSQPVELSIWKLMGLKKKQHKKIQATKRMLGVGPYSIKNL